MFYDLQIEGVWVGFLAGAEITGIIAFLVGTWWVRRVSKRLWQFRRFEGEL
jgi:membrane protein DedA with SNARE-associated domain